jgi:predicted nucleic-acid-binding protein
MTGLDSNILIRYFQRDDPRQTALAERLIDSRTPDDPGWIAVPVLMELIWVMTRVYKVRRDAVVALLEGLLGSDDLVLEHEERMARAFERYRVGRAEFADYVISECSRDVGCSRTVTFDEIAARDAGMELLK